MIKCIAIDDEPLALRQLRTYIARVPFLELAGEYRNALEASRALEEQSVDLIFCDINMPDLSGIDFVRSLSAEQRPMIVFTTAYSEYAVEGFKLEAIDYLLKPFGFDEFNRAAQRAKSLSELIRSRREHPEETTESISLPQDSREFLSIKTDHMVSLVKFENIIYLESMGEYVRIHTTEGKTLTAPQEGESEALPKDKEYISVKADYKVSLVKISDIVYLESEGEYVRMHLIDGSTITTLFRLKNMEAALPADTFMRVHRSYIVNLRRIAGYAKGRIFFSTDENDFVPIGENYRETFAAYTEKAYNTL